MSEPSFSVAMAALRERFRGTTLERLAALERAVGALGAAPSAEEARAAGESAAHKLAGSLGTFGLPAASRLAREAESLLGGGAPPDVARLRELAAALRAEVERA